MRGHEARPSASRAAADPRFSAPPLELAGVTVFGGTPGAPVLRNVRLAVRPGEWVTILGANGSGKSTLVGVTAGLVEPDEGTVRRGFAGNGPIPCVMQQIGPFFGDTPWEEVMVALEGRGIPPEEAVARAEAVLRSTGLFPVRHRPLAALSGGRRQLAAVAACLATGAPLLLLDEATSMLDEASRRLVLASVRRLCREGAAVLWCTHRPEDAAAGDRIVVLSDGKVAFDGTAESFYYREDGTGRTPCEALGFTPPFAVRTARTLMRMGRMAAIRPVTAGQLAAAIRPLVPASRNGPCQPAGMALPRGNGKSHGNGEPYGNAGPRPKAAPAERPLPDGKGIFVERAVCAPGGQPVLSGLDVHFPAGTITLVAGRNGSGKTMLLEMMAGIRKPDGGQVYVDGIPLWRGRKPDPRALGRLGFAMQHPEQMLFARTVREEFACSLKPCRWPASRQQAAVERAVARWMDAAGDGAVAGWLSRDPLAMSGGQRRRLAMAVTEAPEPDWLLLDEPSAGLDRPMLERLRRRLAERRAEGRGAVVVVHDLEDWMDLADRIVLMRDGRIVWTGTPDRLADHPAPLKEAGLALPEPLLVADLLRKAGFCPPAGWPDPAAMAEAVAAQGALADGPAGGDGGNADGHDPTGRGEPEDGPEAESGGPETDACAPSLPATAAFDPRALWLAGLIVTAGIGMQTSWAGWLAGAAASVLAVRFTGVPPRTALRPVKALLLFALITSVAAGWDPSAGDRPLPFGPFDLETAVATFRRFSKLAMMALVGFSLMAGLSPYRLKKALEGGLAPLAARGVPVARFALASALLLRFLPLLFETWERFARIAAFRGKRPVKPGTVPPSLVAMTVMPFLLALVRFGNDLAAMLAARGIGGTGGGPYIVRGPSPSFARRDALLAAGAVTLLAVFILIENMA